MKVDRKTDPAQGVQQTIDFFGAEQTVGFYNTFAAKQKEIPGVNCAFDPDTGEVHAMRGKNFASFQFHPESVLTENGFEILRDALLDLFKKNHVFTPKT